VKHVSSKIVVVLSLGCLPPADSDGRKPSFWKHAETGICFAEFATSYGFYVSTDVPCSPEVERVISKGATRKPNRTGD